VLDRAPAAGLLSRLLSGVRSEGMPSQLPGLSSTGAGQGRPGSQLARALGLGLDAWPAAVRTLGRWEGLPGGDVRAQLARRGRVFQKEPAIATAVRELPMTVSQFCRTTPATATAALTTAKTANSVRVGPEDGVRSSATPGIVAAEPN